MAMTKTIQATVKNRTDTAANWTQKNPVLAEGEIIVVQTSAGETRIKIGDGVKTFTQLPYTDEQIYNNVVTSVNGQTGDVTLDIPGGGADWAQNDPDGDGYVANRPGGYMTDPVITDVDTFAITSAEVKSGVYFAVVAVESSAITLSDYTIGDGVIVDFSGQSYSLTWQSSEGYPTCGASVTDEGFDWSAAPFLIMAVFGGDGGLQGYYVYLQNAVTSPIQVKLTMAKQTPVKIPEKYLELDSAKEIMQFTISYNQSSEAYESDRTYDELKAALDAGKIVLAKFRNVMGEFYTYGLLYQRAMSVPGIWVYVGGSDPCEWQCAEGNKWTKRQLLRLGKGIVYPKKAGIAAYGTSEYASRDDHVHPSELPDVSADDDGKLLGVIGGAWGKMDKPEATQSAAGLMSAADKAKLDGIERGANKTTNTVLYTAQTLTDEQKKQARENVDAADADFVITATITGNDNFTTDKTYTQIQEAVQAGKKVVVKIKAYGFDFVLPLIGKFESDYMFTTVLNLANTVVMQFTIVIGEQGNGIAKCRIPTYNSDGNALEQVIMEADPTEDMEIATKKYVDNKISDKELILSSSTAGSTKKFKLTIDDTGTLTASEITA